MKRYVMTFLVLLVLPFVLSANTTNTDEGVIPIGTTSKEVGVNVELDYSKSITNGTNVAFSLKPIQDTSYKGFDNVKSVDAFHLNKFKDAGVGIVAESGKAYICWQIYTPYSVDIKMYMNSALKNPSNALLNWYFSVDGKQYGYSGTDVFDYVANSSKCTAVIASIEQYTAGLSGSKLFTISTQPLEPSAVGKPFNAILYAEICTK